MTLGQWNGSSALAFDGTDELIVRIDEVTTRRIQEFADSLEITIEEAATRLLRLAAAVREEMTKRGLPAGNHPGEFIVSIDQSPDGVRGVCFKRLT